MVQMSFNLKTEPNCTVRRRHGNGAGTKFSTPAPPPLQCTRPRPKPVWDKKFTPKLAPSWDGFPSPAQTPTREAVVKKKVIFSHI